jgi:hypothetical protein
MTTNNIDLFLDNPSYKKLLSKSGLVIGERKKDGMHLYMGGKKGYHR